MIGVKTTIKFDTVTKMINGLSTALQEVSTTGLDSATDLIFRQIQLQRTRDLLPTDQNNYAVSIVKSEGKREIVNQSNQVIFSEYGTGKFMDSNNFGRYGRGQGENPPWRVHESMADLSAKVDGVNIKKGGEFYIVYGEEAKHIFLNSFLNSSEAATTEYAARLQEAIARYCK